jgi:hypothetical protein
MADIQEPISAYKAQYPFNNVMQTESGHVQEFDDTPGSERIRTQHKCGTFSEWHPDGTVVDRIEGKGYRIVAKDDNVIIKGKCNIQIDGNAEITVKGDVKTNIQGSSETVIEKNYNLLVKGNYTVSSGDKLKMLAPSTLGGISLTTPGAVTYNSDLYVHGKISGKSIFSENDITCATGLKVGIESPDNPVGCFAGITTLGGINVGPVGGRGLTVPGVVKADALVTAPAVVGTVIVVSPIVFGGLLLDPVGGAPGIRAIYDTHQHGVINHSITTMPFAPMPLP